MSDDMPMDFDFDMGDIPFEEEIDISYDIPFEDDTLDVEMAEEFYTPDITEEVDLMKPGPYAVESIPARGPDRDFSTEERDAIDTLGNTYGCHSCGTMDPGTKSGHFIPDHQPPDNLISEGEPQDLYPQCLSCSCKQGGQLRAAMEK